MYSFNIDQEKNPDNYILTNIDPTFTEDECHDLLTKPRQIQNTIGLYTLKAKCHSLELELERNNGFWVGKPQEWGHVTQKLKEKCTVDMPKKTQRDMGIFCRPYYMELEYHKMLAKAGLLYSDEEESDDEDDEEQDKTYCLPLRKIKYKTYDPCKEKEERKEKKEIPSESPPKDILEELSRQGINPKLKKIPTGCQCDYYGTHNEPPTMHETIQM
ncbi:hypothetical protein Phum_PHUM537090 [Pediculus humanus corporis]|uniref:Uncharacterized protein n=1 Tax=Pediculus humanus subsp. corporis TaxID=121224 RepID=E0VZP1_PEDHC|nr:uncharacterized protein Phum_PHUM537090 [Pediculus humanus corporis]EEB18847.1 hypothetical protein Phum_PHUM537090 [Pediculus humanus corporis]